MLCNECCGQWEQCGCVGDEPWDYFMDGSPLVEFTKDDSIRIDYSGGQFDLRSIHLSDCESRPFGWRVRLWPRANGEPTDPLDVEVEGDDIALEDVAPAYADADLEEFRELVELKPDELQVIYGGELFDASGIYVSETRNKARLSLALPGVEHYVPIEDVEVV